MTFPSTDYLLFQVILSLAARQPFAVTMPLHQRFQIRMSTHHYVQIIALKQRCRYRQRQFESLQPDLLVLLALDLTPQLYNPLL